MSLYLKSIEEADPTIYVHRGRSNRKINYVELVQLLADGFTAKGAAAQLNIKTDTVGDILLQLRRVHRVKTTAQLVAHYVRNGIID